MMKRFIAIILLSSNLAIAQENLTSDLLESQAFRFAIGDDLLLPENASMKWENWIEGNQFVGLAEVHNSRQLSLFTTALLTVLEEQGFNNLALELGPNTSEVLNEYAANSSTLGEQIRDINNRYGTSSVYKTPFIFINKQSDALFVNRAAELGFTFWGLDQEYAYSYEMLVDRLYLLEPNPSDTQQELYSNTKELLQKRMFKSKVGGQPTYCWYQTNQTINDYLDSFEGNPTAEKMIADMRESWDIYCKSATGVGSNQQRANHMKDNFEDYYAKSAPLPKVFLKLGGVHLTHEKSPFGVDDMGKFLQEKASQNDTGFLSIRHLIAYRNGKSNIGKSGWTAVSVFLELGRKDQWTAVDLRPFRKQLQEGLIIANEKYTYELMNYDILLISPDDQYDKPNY